MAEDSIPPDVWLRQQAEAWKEPVKRYEAAQLRIITEKILLGDDEAKRRQEEGGASGRARIVAQDQRLCSCVRTDGLICGRTLLTKGPRCWVCYSNQLDGKPCDHLGRKHD